MIYPKSEVYHQIYRTWKKLLLLILPRVKAAPGEEHHNWLTISIYSLISLSQHILIHNGFRFGLVV